MANRKIDDSASVVYEVDDHTSLLLRALDEIGISTHQAYGSTFVMPREKRYLTLDNVSRYLNELNGKPQYRAMADKPYPYLEVRQSSYADRIGMYMMGKFYFSDIDDGGEWREYGQLLLLHEFAHYLGGSGHGDRFRKAYLHLIAEEMSPELSRYMQIRMYEETENIKKMKGK